ncbi:MAG: hypothetical protein RJB13_1461 [Pseudomonadota bacterium]|jgi:Fe2+ transport system protein B
MDFIFVSILLIFVLGLPLFFFVMFALKKTKPTEGQEACVDEVSQHVRSMNRFVVSILIGLPLLGILFRMNVSVTIFVTYAVVTVLSLAVMVFRASSLMGIFSDKIAKRRIRDALILGLIMFPFSALAG